MLDLENLGVEVNISDCPFSAENFALLRLYRNVLLAKSRILGLIPSSQHICIFIGQRTVFYCFGCPLHIVREANEFYGDAVGAGDRAIGVNRQQHVAAPGIAVFRLSHRANINCMAVGGLGIAGLLYDAMVGFMCMTKQHDVGICVFHNA